MAANAASLTCKARSAAIGCVLRPLAIRVIERAAQFGQPNPNQGLHGAERYALSCSNLTVAQARKIGEFQRLTLWYG
jgi:hypothetical protein